MPLFSATAHLSRGILCGNAAHTRVTLTLVPQPLIGFTLQPFPGLNFTQLGLEWQNSEFVAEPRGVLFASEIHPQKSLSHLDLLPRLWRPVPCAPGTCHAVHMRRSMPALPLTAPLTDTNLDITEHACVLEGRPHTSTHTHTHSPHRAHGHKSTC